MASKFGGIAVEPEADGSRFGGTLVEEAAPAVAQPTAPVPSGPDYTAKMADLMDRYKKGYGLEIRQMNLIEAMAKKKGLNISYGMDRKEGTAGSFFEPLATVASAAIAEPIAGLAGIAQSLNPFADEDAGAEAVETVRDWMTYVPESEKAKEVLTEGGELIQPAAEKMDAFRTSLGDYTYDLTGSPALAATAATSPEAILGILGIRRLRGMKTGTVLREGPGGRPTKQLRIALDEAGLDYDNLMPEIQKAIPEKVDASFLPARSPVKAEVKRALYEQVKAGGKDDVIAKLKIDKYDRLTPDKLGIEAVKQGFRPGVVTAVKNANPETKVKMKDMLRIMRSIKKNERVALDKRPSVIAGQAVVDRLDYIQNEANMAGKELNRIANEDLAGIPIDNELIFQTLENELKNLDIGIEVADGVASPVFEGSMISKDPASQSHFKNVFDLMAEGDVPDALRIHKLKRQMDAMIDSSKKSASGLSNAGKGFLMAMRKSFNDTIRPIHQGYAEVNDTLSKALQTIDDLDSSVGSLSLTGKSASEGLGTRLRSLMSNYTSRASLIDSLDQLDGTAAELGGNFPDDLKDLAMFANTLDERFGAVAKTSLAGQGEQVAAQLLRGDKIGLAGKLFGKGVEKVRGVSDLNAFESLEALLSEGTTP